MTLRQVADAARTLEQLEQWLAAYDRAADKFIAKCESGQARSRETYADLKAARERRPKS